MRYLWSISGTLQMTNRSDTTLMHFADSNTDLDDFDRFVEDVDLKA